MCPSVYKSSTKLSCATQQGAALIITLLILLAVLFIGISAAQLALTGEKTARNERDRQTAFQAAEAALLDAEADIELSPDPVKSRSALFSSHNTHIFPLDTPGQCYRGGDNRYRGLCLPAASDNLPVWQTVNFSDTSALAASVAYGSFTGHTLQTGQGALSAFLPRYIIELLPDRQPGAESDPLNNKIIYRISAIGFGSHATTQVLLQSFYRKENEEKSEN